ncbi:MAG: hydantoinase/oxoprolinase family protein [Candidatus Bathyarchaeia archaeon]
MNALGLDIGGANTKAAFIKTTNGYIHEVKTVVEYFPIWKNPNKLDAVLSELKNRIAGSCGFDIVSVTMTAELSDAYQTKREGVNQILTQVMQVFLDTQLLVLDVNATLKSIAEARAEPLKVAAANWVATGWMVAQFISNCIIIDTGSTSTSIIPIINGQISAAGKTDLEKLVNGELVYTGSLRTNVATIVNAIPLKCGISRVSSELFAQSGDVHLVLGHLAPREYTVETPDGRGTTKKDAFARLARVVCADTEILTEQELIDAATYIYNRQIEQIADGLKQVYSRIKPNIKTNLKIVVAGLGKNFLAKKAAELCGFSEIIDLNEILKSDVAIASPAVGVALMAISKVEGTVPRWMQQ